MNKTEEFCAVGAVFVFRASLRPVYTYKFAFSGFFHGEGGGWGGAAICIRSS